MFTPKEKALERGWPGRIDGDRIVQLAAQTLQAFFTGGGSAREHAEYPLADCDLLAPVLYPGAIRVFSPFEGLATPFFSFRSPFPVSGPDAEIPYPEGTEDLDAGVALAAVIGEENTIGGFTIANDWTARDLAREERAAGFGPSKSTDFALSLGPLLLTPDEPAPARVVLRVNGEERRTVDFVALPWDAMLAHAGRNLTLRSGDVLVARAAPGDGPALARGDLVELEADGIGALANRIV
jgi:fumarylacetoacetate (FAA) hydrolase